MNKSEPIEELIARYLEGNASPEEAMELDHWMEKSPSNKDYFIQLQKVFNAGILPAQGLPNTDSAWAKVQQQITNNGKVVPIKRNNFNYLYKIAALLISVPLLVFYFYYQWNSGHSKVYESLAQKQEFSLEDGSKVQLFPQSKLTVADSFGGKIRMLKLSGSASFKVVHDDKVPFIVDVGKVFVKDIGTQFDIKSSADSDTVFVKVNEGIVLLFDSATTSIELKAGERAIYVKSIGKVLAEDNTPNYTGIELNFVGAALSQVIKEVEAAYHIHIQLESPLLGKCKLTSRFNNESPETVIQILTETLGFSYTYNSVTGLYTIKGKECTP